MISINKRCIRILKMLINSGEPLSYSKIADDINVSERTIRYDLKVLSEWLREKQIKLVSKSREGIFIEDKVKVKKILEQHPYYETEYEYYFNSDERVKIIISKVLKSEKKLHVNDLMEELYVSRSTVIKDLNEAEKWLKQRNAVLYRKQNRGIYLDVSEKEWRRLIKEFIYENASPEMLLEVFLDTSLYKSNKNSLLYEIQSYLNNIIEIVDFERLNQAIRLVESRFEVRFSDYAYRDLLVRISIAVDRLSNNKIIDMTEDELNVIRKTKEYNIVKEVITPVISEKLTAFPDCEIAYMALNFMCSQIRSQIINKDDNDKDAINKDVQEILEIIINTVKKHYGINLMHNEELINGMYIHLKPAIMRYRYGLSITNPILENLKRDYPKIFDITKEALLEIKELMGIGLDESEAGYIAMHLESAIQSYISRDKAVITRVVLVCGSGIGTVKMLSTRIKKEFSWIKVEAELSALDARDYDYRGIDLIISTVNIPIVLSKPTIYVSALLTNSDIKKINAFLNSSLYDSNRSDNYLQYMIKIIEDNCIVNNYDNLLNKLGVLVGSSTQQQPLDDNFPGLLDILSKDNILVGLEAESWDDAVTASCTPLVESGAINSEYIHELIEAKNKYDQYSIIFPEVCMPHTNPLNNVSSLAMGLSTFNKPINVRILNEDIPIRVMFVLAPIDRDKHLKALGQLLNILDEYPNFVNDICNSKKPVEIYSIIKKCISCL